jgi:hypothetical protein
MQKYLEILAWDDIMVATKTVKVQKNATQPKHLPRLILCIQYTVWLCTWTNNGKVKAEQIVREVTALLKQYCTYTDSAFNTLY